MDWLTLKEAATIMGVHWSSVRRLALRDDPLSQKPYLISCKPLPSAWRISRASVLAHLDAVQADPEFWERRKAFGRNHKT